MLDVLIIGGGIHGTALSHILTRTRAVARDRIAVLDPHEEPLADWKRMTRSCGMKYLRSPGAHGIDGDFTSPGRYAASTGMNGPADSIPPNRRPSLELFNRHAVEVIEKHRLAELRIKGRASNLRPSPGRVFTETDNGSVEAARVILCVGRGEQLFVPKAFAGLPGERCIHVYDPRFGGAGGDGGSRDGDSRDGGFSPRGAPAHAPGLSASTARRIAVIGGGIAAAQLTVALARREPRAAGSNPVAMISPHEPLIAQYDSDPCYIGPRCAGEFLSKGPTGRRKILSAARNPGSMPPDVFADLEAAVNTGEATFTAEPKLLSVSSADEIPAIEESDLVLLATGFRGGPPIKNLVKTLSENHDLAVDPAGFPLVDRHLRWHERIFAAGPLGELELGPAAGNIIGAHLAARRLVPFLLEAESAALPWKPLTIWWPNH